MRLTVQAAIAATLLGGASLLSASPSQAQANPKEVAARVELHSIPSLTLSDQQFLNGDAGGKPAYDRIRQGIDTLRRHDLPFSALCVVGRPEPVAALAQRLSPAALAEAS